MGDSVESCRFETTETLAAFMASTPLLMESWKLCNEANAVGNILTKYGDGIWYIAFPAVAKLPSGKLVVLDAAGDELFSTFRSSSAAADESPPMVDAEMLSLFSAMFTHIQQQIRGCMDGRKLVLTGHSIGGAVASLSALWLLSYLKSLSTSSLHVLCVTFGSALLGNRSLTTSIFRNRLDRNFCHVASTRDIVPRFLLSPHSPEMAHLISTSLNIQNAYSPNGLRISDYFPFGNYLFCSEEGAICIDDATSISRMLVMLNTRSSAVDIEDHLKYGHYVEIISQQFLNARSFKGVNVSESSYGVGVALAVGAMGISHEEPEAAEARECIEMARRIGRAPILKSAELAVELARFLRCRLEIQWYKERCDASEEQLGYYDFFKRGTMRRDAAVNMSRVKLAKFWDGVIEMIENNELPFDFHLRPKWFYASQFYQLLAEPLDIAYFYKNRRTEERGKHYMMHGIRPKRYVAFDKWWSERPEAHKKKYERTRYASATQDTCFWAKLEEAKEYLDDVKSDFEGYKQSILWEKITAFGRYADELVKTKEVSIDVLAKNSSYIRWVEAVRELKSQMSPELMDVEHAPMETI